MASSAHVVRAGEALRRQFPHVDADALDAFCSACELGPTAEVIDALAEMQREVASSTAGSVGALHCRDCTVRRDPVSGQASTAGSELGDGVRISSVELSLDGGSDAPRVGTVLAIGGVLGCVCGGEGEGRESELLSSSRRTDGVSVSMALPSGELFAIELHQGPLYFWIRDYGMHELRIQALDGTLLRTTFMSTSYLGEFAASLDRFHDVCDWVWDGTWTEELEEATLGLLAALDTYFEETEAELGGASMGAMLMSELRPAKRRLENHLAKVLEDHDAQSVGRVYGAVRALLTSQCLLDMFGPMMGSVGRKQPIQETFLYEAVVTFERARFTSASADKQAGLVAALSKLILAADAYLSESAAGGSAFERKWNGGLREEFLLMRDCGSTIHPWPFFELRGGGGGYISDMMKNVMGSFSAPSQSVDRADAVEGLPSLLPQAAFSECRTRVSRWIESLVEDSVTFGNPAAPFEVHGAEPWVRTVIAALTSLLSLGFGYVTQNAESPPSSKFIVLLDRDRAVLPLQSPWEFLADRRRRDRLKDVCRVIRALRKKGQRFSLVVNSNFSFALNALKEHHSDNWVGENLEAVWQAMLSDSRVCSFELWFWSSATTQSPTLVAADFGHPHTFGRAYYVATRFFDREFRHLQPGFILAFAEAECLRRSGFSLWDLGGADKSPMMQYKPQVAIEMDRCDFIRRLRECERTTMLDLGGKDGTVSEVQKSHLPLTDPLAAPPHGAYNVPTGDVFTDITEGELWGSASLRAMEAKLLQESKSSAPPKKLKRGPRRDCATVAVAEAHDTKDTARQHFLRLCQQYCSEGLSQQDAVVKALETVAKNNQTADRLT